MVNNIAFQRKLRKLKKPLRFSHVLPTMRIMCNRQFSINKEVEADKSYSLKIHFTAFRAFFFLFRFSLTNTRNSQDIRERGGFFFSSSLPLPPASQKLRR